MIKSVLWLVLVFFYLLIFKFEKKNNIFVNLLWKMGYMIVGDKSFVFKVDLIYIEELYDCYSDFCWVLNYLKLN